jgi:dTDP-4-dehydrorhamnose 3,5-epimerase|tara:strand:+ start:921 stop:1436 length:516 start_codon:yes stop_codon:yes gene_type:complete
LIIKDTKLHGVKLIIPEVFEDHRGSYVELYDSEKFNSAIGEVNFVQDDISISRRNVLRGLHGDFKTTKLVTVLKGSGYALIADNRTYSPTYKKWQAFTLNGENRKQLLLPPGIGNSILALDEEIVYYYKQDTHFTDGKQFTIKWNDSDWDFWWPIKNPILSMRDEKGDYVS